MAAHHPRSELAAPPTPFERCFDDMYALLPFEVEGSNACFAGDIPFQPLALNFTSASDEDRKQIAELAKARDPSSQVVKRSPLSISIRFTPICHSRRPPATRESPCKNPGCSHSFSGEFDRSLFE